MQFFSFLASKKLMKKFEKIKQSLDLKGASGHLQCVLCSNVVSKYVAKTANLALTDMVGLSELDVSKFQAHSDESFIKNA